MSKMIAGLLFIWILLTIFSAFAYGQGGINSTVLTSAMGATDTSAAVQSTSGFLPGGDYVTIGGEQMRYTSLDMTHFYGLVRSGGSPHANSTMVYNQQSNLLNASLGFNVNAVTTSSGLISIFTIPLKFFTTTLPNIITGSSIMPLLPGMWAFLGWIWIAITSGVVISLGVSLVWVLSGIVGKL
jgi:hypothetical protein